MTPEFQQRCNQIAELHLADRAPVRVTQIVRAVSEGTGLTVAEILGQSRLGPIARARQLVMFEAYAAGYSMAHIGRILRRDHTTVMHGIRAERERRAKQ